MNLSVELIINTNNTIKIKNTLIAVAFIASAGFSQAATVAGMVDSKAPENVTATSATLAGLTVTDGTFTVTFDLSLTGVFVFNDNTGATLLASTVNANRKEITWTVSNVSVNDPSQTVTFDGFTSLNAYNDVTNNPSNYDLTTDTGTVSLIATNTGNGSTTMGSGIETAPGTLVPFATPTSLLEVDATVSGGVGFVRYNQVGVQFTVVPEPSSTALLGLGGLALILRRRK